MTGWLDHPGAPPVRDALIRRVVGGSAGAVRVDVEVNPLEDITFRPGAVAVFSGEDGRPVYLAIASSPGALPVLEFHVSNPKVAAEFMELEGRAVRVQFPVGDGYPLEQMIGVPVVLIGMGSGLAPLRSALQPMLESREQFPEIALLHGATSEAETPFASEVPGWEDAGVRVIRSVTRESPTRAGMRTGRVQAHFEEALPDERDCWVILCGSQEMIAESRTILEGMGVSAERVVTNW